MRRAEICRSSLHRQRAIKYLLLFAAFLFVPAWMWATDGHFLHGVGPVNEAMGGADTGICVDAAGSIAWNPACTSRFYGKDWEIYGSLFLPWRNVSSTVNADAFGPGVPSTTLSGTTQSHRDASFLPGLAFIYHKKSSKNAYSIAAEALSGFGVDYNESTNFSNPILTPQPPNGFGFGAIQSAYDLLGVPVGISRQVSHRLSLGMSVMPSFSMLKVMPAPFAAPVSAGSSMPYYLSAYDYAPALGIGVEAGLQYQFNRVLSAGLAYHSPVWFRDFQWQTADLTGAMHTLKFQMNLPQLMTAGIGISPTKGTRIGADARWFNYANTAGFSEAGFDKDDAVSGFGWRNIWAAGGGIMQQITTSTTLIAGYNYSQNPIPSAYAFLNVPAPAIVQHHVTAGVIQKIHGGWNLEGSYYHGFRNSLTGPWLSPQGQIPGTSVTSRLSENSVTIGLSMHFSIYKHQKLLMQARAMHKENR